MAESKYINKLCEWFNVDRDKILDLDVMTYLKMTEAMDNDDYMALHHLGYEIKRYEGIMIR